MNSTNARRPLQWAARRYYTTPSSNRGGSQKLLRDEGRPQALNGKRLQLTKTEHEYGFSPNRKRILARPDVLAWVGKAQEDVRLRAGPIRAAIVGDHGLPLRKWFPYRIDKAQGSFFVELRPEVEAFVQAPPLPVIKQPHSEPRLLKPLTPPGRAISHLACLDRYLEVLHPDARQKFLAWMKAYWRDADAIEAQARGHGTTHRLRLESGTLKG